MNEQIFLLVGLGSMGKRRARLLHGLRPGAFLCGVDSNPDRRAEALRLGLVGEAWDGIPAALAAHSGAGAFAGALVCTAPLTHAGIIHTLLTAGLPVFTELNLVDDGYAENLALAQKNGLPLFLSSTMLYRRETQYIKSRVAAFGRPVHYLYHIGQYLPVARNRTCEYVVDHHSGNSGYKADCSGQKRFGNLSLDIATTSPEEFLRFLVSELKQWGEVVKAAGIKAE